MQADPTNVDAISEYAYFLHKNKDDAEGATL